MRVRSKKSSAGLEHYDRDEIWRGRYWTDGERERARNTVALVPAGVRSILDVGCGAGILIRELKKSGMSVIGLDFASAPLVQVPHPKVQGDARALPFRAAQFEAVLAAEVVEHLPRRVMNEVLREFVRVAETWVILSVPYREVLECGYVCCGQCGCRFHASRHTTSFDERRLRDLLAPEFLLERTVILGPRTRYVPSLLARLTQVFGGYANPDRFALCPACGNNEDFVHRHNLATRLLKGLAWRLVPSRKGLWIAGRYRRRVLDRDRIRDD